ncbi:MAG TPA: hypothetical protein VIL85_26325 [Thermomicrobiales bacterium]
MTATSSGEEPRATTTRFAVRFSPLRAWFILGTTLSGLGFALPWFRISRSYEWWYGGWHLLTTNEPDLWWIVFLFLGYLILLSAGYWLLRLDSLSAGLLASLAIAVALGTVVVVALAAADAVQDQGRVYRLDLNVGLFLMLPGHGLMIVSALGGFIVQLLGELLPADRADRLSAPHDADVR